jgi:hypothetical protein
MTPWMGLDLYTQDIYGTVCQPDLCRRALTIHAMARLLISLSDWGLQNAYPKAMRRFTALNVLLLWANDASLREMAHCPTWQLRQWITIVTPSSGPSL